jgi:hypothetical protein
MMSKRHASMILAIIGLVVSTLACNAPTPAPQAPSPIMTPETPSAAPAQETPLPPPTQAPTTTPTSVPPASAETATPETPPPTETGTPTAERPTPSPPVSAGPLDFPVPAALDSWRSLPDGVQEATIILHITGGAPPYTIHHDLDVFTTDQADPAIVFTARGCDALVHTIVVESADGQSVKQVYWIRAPWCD